jgi:hypothetical protein
MEKWHWKKNISDTLKQFMASYKLVFRKLASAELKKTRKMAELLYKNLKSL